MAAYPQEMSRFIHSRYALVPLYISWASWQAFTFLHYGVSPGGDTVRYVNAAHRIQDGLLPTGKALSYLSYDYFVALIFMLGENLLFVAIAQVLVSGIALYGLFRIGEILFSRTVGWLAGLLYAAYPEFAYWNSVIYTDAFYTSVLIIAVWRILFSKTAPQFIFAIALVLIAGLARPHGLGFLSVMILYGFCNLVRGKQYLILAITSAVLLFSTPVLWQALGTMSAYETLVRHYQDGTVIWGYAEADIPVDSEQSDFSSSYSHPMVNLAAYVLEYPARVSQLAAHKLGYFFSHMRPYYANYHNLLSVVYLFPCYLFAVLGAYIARPSIPCSRSLLLGIPFAQTVIVSASFADWDGRHVIPILPWIFLLAASGLMSMVKHIKLWKGRGKIPATP